MSADLVPLDAAEMAELAECEATIQNGLRTFVDVGRSLARIRDGRLYRQTHTTFEAYCEQEYALSRPRAYQLIDAAKITEAMSTNVDTPAPATESQARELSGLDPETAAQVMRSAAESEQRVTAAAIARSREQIAPKPDSPFTKVRTEVLVNKETGEVVDTETGMRPVRTSDGVASADPIRDALNDHLNNDVDGKRLTYQASFARAVGAVSKLAAEFDPAEVAALIDQDEVESLARIASSLNQFIAKVRERQAPGLRVVGK